MNKLKETLKFKLLPKKLYLAISACKKYHRAEKKGECELRLLPFLVDRNKTSIDVGANTGLYTYFLSKYSRRVFAFEPHQSLAEFLTKAAPANTQIENCAVSDNCGETTFYTPLINGEKSLNIASIEKESMGDAEYVEEKMTTKTIDSFELDDVGFIKIDVEGHEMDVLKGAEKTIQTCRPVMLIEILDPQGNLEDNPAVKFMLSHDYRVSDLHNNVLRLVDATKPYDASNRNFLFLPNKAA